MKNLYFLFSGRIRFYSLLTIFMSVVFIQKYNGQVSSYTFSQSNVTYSEITGTTLATATGNASATNLNSAVYPVTLPFNFNFNGVIYTSANVSTNGFITFGTTAPSTTNTTPISSAVAYNGVISAFGRDISSFFDVSGASGVISYESLGSAHDREFVIQWKNFRPNSATVTTNVYSFSFQIRLKESTNTVSAVYNSGNFLTGSTAITGTVQIGLRGTTNADFNNRLNDTSVLFNASSPGTANASTQSFNTSVATPGMPSADLVYNWTPPVCYSPSAITVNSTSSNSASISWAATTSAPGGYDIYYSTVNTAPVSSTTPNLQNVPGLAATLSPLSSAMTYFVWIRSNCGSAGVGTWISKPVILRTACESVSILTTSAPTACPNQSAVLSATSTPGSNIIWYDGNDNIVGTGNSFTTPALSTSTTYYAAASTGSVTALITNGKSTYSPGPTSGAGTTEFGLVFDVLSAFTLKNVTIYPTSATGASGTVVIDVVDSEGSLVHTKTVSVTASPTASPVPQVVTLDFPMVPGIGYKIRHSARSAGIGGLLFDPSATAPSGNYGYPYITAGILSINTSTLTANNTPRNDLYYYFYDWKVGPGCQSAKVAVVANVDSNCLSTNETDAKDKLKVYPNPFTDIIYISDVSKVKNIRISDTSGKIVRNISKPQSELRLSELPAGMYVILLEMNDGTGQTIKTIKR